MMSRRTSQNVNNRRRFMNFRNTAKRNNLREKTRNYIDGDDNSVMKEVDDCSDDDSGADEEFDLNKAFDLEGEEKSDELLEDFADEATCIREQCKEWDNEAKCKLSKMVRNVYCRLMSFDVFRLQSYRLRNYVTYVCPLLIPNGTIEKQSKLGKVMILNFEAKRDLFIADCKVKFTHLKYVNAHLKLDFSELPLEISEGNSDSKFVADISREDTFLLMTMIIVGWRFCGFC